MTVLTGEDGQTFVADAVETAEDRGVVGLRWVRRDNACPSRVLQVGINRTRHQKGGGFINGIVWEDVPEVSE